MSSLPLRPVRSQAAALYGVTLGTSMSNLAQTTILGLVIYELTRSELDLGLLGLAEFAPALVLVAVAGSVVDRFDRRHVAALGAVANSVVALALAWYTRDAHRLSSTPIFLLVLAFGVGQAFLAPALRALPLAMVANDGVPWLVARRSVVSEAAAILGPILGGFLYDAGVWLALVVVGVLSALAAAAVLAIRIPHPPAGQPHRGKLPGRGEEVGHLPEDGIPAWRGTIHDALEGLRFVRAQSILLGAISLDLVAVLFGGAVTLLPAVAVQLHVGAVGLGWLRASAGMGAGVMTVLISIRPIERRVGRVLLTVVGAFGLWTIVLGLARSFILAFVAMFALSAADAVSVFIRSTLVPLATPPAMRGRVLAVENVFIGASNELGGFESGVVGQLLGTTGSILLGGIATVIVAITWGLLFPSLRRVDGFPTPPTGPGAEEGSE